MAEIITIVHSELDLTERVVVGELSVDDVLGEIRRSYDGPVTKLVLWDVSQASTRSINGDDMMRIAELVSQFISRRAGGRSAVVASTDLSFGMTRMYQAYRSMQNIKPPFMSFRTREQAMAWLVSDVN